MASAGLSKGEDEDARIGLLQGQKDSSETQTYTAPKDPSLRQTPRSKSRVPGKGFLAALFYSIASCAMTLLNKAVLSEYSWGAPIALLVFQNLLIAIVILLLRLFGKVPAQPLTWRLVRIWLPTNFIFVGMLITSFYALSYLQVPVATILKNCTNVLTALGETQMNGRRHDIMVWFSLLLMILSALCAGYTDLSFHPIGYSWQALNCVLTAAYSLSLRHAMSAARSVTPNNEPLPETTMVLLNATLSLPLCLSLCLLFGEPTFLLSTPLLSSASFWSAAAASAAFGLAVSFSSMWCLHLTSPTTYGLVGSMNKVPLAVLGIVLFRAPVNASSLTSIVVGLVAAVLFAYAKARAAKMRQQPQEAAKGEGP